MPEMPTLGTQPKQRPYIPIAVTAVVVSALTGGLFFIKTRTAEPPGVASPAPAPNTAAALDPNPALAAPGATAAFDPSPNTGATPAAAAPPAASPTPTAAIGAPAAVPTTTVAEKSSQHAFSVTINGPLESAIIASEGKDIGSPLTQVVNRSLVWWVRVPQDLVKGDTLSVVYETRDGQEPLVHAVRFASRKNGRTYEAYRFKPSNDGFARYYQADGSELEERIIDGPLDSWEQVTSLLRDGRRHKGVDFKTPSGSPVKATFDGVVARKNWNFRGNGNSVEIHESGGQGRAALFLHLSELPKSLAVGQRIKKGEVFAKSGNTGHSFAPHLHYQLMQGEKVIDPFESHKTTRIALPGSEKAAFDRKRTELEALMPATALAGG